MVGVASRGLASSTLGLGRHGRLRPGAPCSVVVVDRRWPASPRGERWVVQSLITGVGLAYTVGFRPRKEEGRQPTEWTSVCNKSFPHHGVPCCPDATMLGPPYDFLSLSHIVRAAFSHPHGFLQPLIVTNGLIFVGQSLMARTYSRTIGCLHRSRAARQDTGSTPAAPSSTLRFRGLRPGIRCHQSWTPPRDGDVLADFSLPVDSRLRDGEEMHTEGAEAMCGVWVPMAFVSRHRIVLTSHAISL
jgi:hypothetical protein